MNDDLLDNYLITFIKHHIFYVNERRYYYFFYGH
jgi:hypothetical protein